LISVLGGALPCVLEAQAQWRRVLLVLWHDERRRSWGAPQFLSIPGTDAVILAELARREALGRYDPASVSSLQGPRPAGVRGGTQG